MIVHRLIKKKKRIEILGIVFTFTDFFQISNFIVSQEVAKTVQRGLVYFHPNVTSYMIIVHIKTRNLTLVQYVYIILSHFIACIDL